MKKNGRCRHELIPIVDSDQKIIADLMWSVIKLQHGDDPRYRRWALHLFKDLLWRWTADGFCAKCKSIIPDKIKYDPRYQFFTNEALAIWRTKKDIGKKLVHEHAVPKAVLAPLVLAASSPGEVYSLLKPLCFVAVISLDEDEKLRDAGLNANMPDNWDGKDPWARYSMVDLKMNRPSES